MPSCIFRAVVARSAPGPLAAVGGRLDTPPKPRLRPPRRAISRAACVACCAPRSPRASVCQPLRRDVDPPDASHLWHRCMPCCVPVHSRIDPPRASHELHTGRRPLRGTTATDAAAPGASGGGVGERAIPPVGFRASRGHPPLESLRWEGALDDAHDAMHTPPVGT